MHGSPSPATRVPNCWSPGLLIESGAEVPYVGTACPRTPWSDADREWLEARGIRVQYRASLEMDLAAVREFTPNLAIGTTPAGAESKAAGDSGIVFHQFDFGAAAVRRCRRGLAGAGR